MSTQQEQTTLVLSAGTLTGDRVKNSAGDDLGKVEEIMIDLRDGRVSYVVLSFGGFMGLGDKYFAIPWAMLEVDLEEKCFRLDLDKQILEEAPGFDKDNWPEVTPDWLFDLYDYYDLPPYWG
jgi:hypothetical protein